MCWQFSNEGGDHLGHARRARERTSWSVSSIGRERSFPVAALEKTIRRAAITPVSRLFPS